MSINYKIIYTGDEEEWARLLIDGAKDLEYKNGSRFLYHLSSPIPVEEISRGESTKAVTKRWPSTVWRMVIGTHHRHPVARIPTPVGDFIFMRNGNNASAYNYAVLRVSDRKFFYRMVYREALELIELLGCPMKDLPTLINRIECKYNQDIFEQRLKEAA